ncbi:hypothetical protein BDY24DRAFT_417708 [Mrakia frigida]|uniref:uncharacterized protein n=1 Tax=Mrakia frigida TaxID=29902 RepID=UPI003FCC1FD5
MRSPPLSSPLATLFKASNLFQEKPGESQDDNLPEMVLSFEIDSTVTASSYPPRLSDLPLIVKARFVSGLAEAKIKQAGGIVVLTA